MELLWKKTLGHVTALLGQRDLLVSVYSENPRPAQKTITLPTGPDVPLGDVHCQSTDGAVLGRPMAYSADNKVELVVDGRKRWRASGGGSTAIFAGERVLLATARSVSAVALESGERLWMQRRLPVRGRGGLYDVSLHPGVGIVLSGDGSSIAVEPAEGEVLWSVHARDFGAPDGARVRAALADDGRVVLAAADRCTCRAPSGAALWEVKLEPPSPRLPKTSEPLVVDGAVWLVRPVDGARDRLVRLHLESGEVELDLELPRVGGHPPTPVVCSDGTLLVPVWGHEEEPKHQPGLKGLEASAVRAMRPSRAEILEVRDGAILRRHPLPGASAPCLLLQSSGQLVCNIGHHVLAWATAWRPARGWSQRDHDARRSRLITAA